MDQPFNPETDSLEVTELIDHVGDAKLQNERTKSFRSELETLINSNSIENGSNTPDFILATFLTNCLLAFDTAVKHREKWYSKDGVSEEEHIDFSKLLSENKDEDE